MSETRALLADSAAKLFAKFETADVLRRVEAGAWPQEIWQGITALGLEQIFSGASDDPWRDACVVLKACGRHVLPAPLAETLMAGALLQAAGLDAPEGALTLAAPRTSSLMVGDDGTLSGKLAHVPWGRFAPYVLAVAEGQLAVLAVNTARVTLDRAVSRLPDDTLVFENVMAVAAAPCNEARAMQFGALMRAAQMAGAMETVLDMTVTYARERQQFGKPIGTFQAIQQQLAMMATQVAAASRAVDAAFDRIADGGEAGFEAAVAKIRCGDAAGQVASIAHQVHGAIGFTDEHRLHYFTRRLWSWRSDFGSASFWAEKLGAPIAALGPDQFWPTITAAG